LASFSDTFSALMFASIFEVILDAFWLHFGSVLVPFWPSKIDLGARVGLETILIDF
jgi:hypothetical protein